MQWLWWGPHLSVLNAEWHRQRAWWMSAGVVTAMAVTNTMAAAKMSDFTAVWERQTQAGLQMDP